MMIKRLGVVVVLIVSTAASLLVSAAPAFADHQVCVTNPVNGTVKCWVVHDPPPGKGGGGGGSSGDGGCSWQGRSVPCSSTAGTFNAANGCYDKAANPYPTSGPVFESWKTGGGAIDWETCPFGLGSGGYVWVPKGAPVPPPAAALGQRAASNLQLPTMTATSNAGTGPTATTYVGIPTWLWLPSGQWHSLKSPPATAAGESVTATATPSLVSWSMGNGSSTSCDGPGAPYSSSDPSNPPCGYTYRVDSSKQPQKGSSPNDRYFTVRGTVTWTISWTCTGAACDENGGDLPNLTRQTTPMPLRVFQVETVVTGGH